MLAKETWRPVKEGKLLQQSSHLIMRGGHVPTIENQSYKPRGEDFKRKHYDGEFGQGREAVKEKSTE